jgi:hypothetical protein
MDSRGPVELVALSADLEARMAGGTLFTALVGAALDTTLTTGPLITSAARRLSVQGP